MKSTRRVPVFAEFSATLARHLGLSQLLQQRLDLVDAPGRANTGDKMMTLVASALAGGDCIDDADALRAGGTAGVLDCMVKAPSTLGTFLRSFRWGHVRQLDRASRELLARAWAAGAGPGDAPFTIDLDSIICETYGLSRLQNSTAGWIASSGGCLGCRRLSNGQPELGPDFRLPSVARTPGNPSVYRSRCLRRRGSSSFTRAGFASDMLAVGQSLRVRERYIGANRPWRAFRQVTGCFEGQAQQVEGGVLVAVVPCAALRAGPVSLPHELCMVMAAVGADLAGREEAARATTVSYSSL